MSTEATFERVRYEVPVDGVARITLARDEARNAQDKTMTYELNAAFDRACFDNDVRVIVLAADGPHFSSGHDMRDKSKMSDHDRVSSWGGYRKPGAEGHLHFEEELYLQMCWRWRNLPKPTVAEVQGKVIAGALMLVWVCDLVIAADDAEFSDPTVAFGVNGVEYFAHPWEVGVRKAKEMLFLGDSFTAEEARQLGMVNRVVPRDELTAETMAVAEKIASKPSMGLTLAKQSVNQMQDAMGMWTALQAAMSLQQLGHSHNQQVHGMPVDPAGMTLGQKKK
jgi:enoyl-CoA hydratase/carnithine racemase